MKTIKMSEQEKQAYVIANQLRKWGEKNNQSNFSFLENFYTLTTQLENGDAIDVIKFKAHSFKNLLGTDAPNDIISRKKDKLLIAFQIGLHNGDPVWRKAVK